MCRSPMQSPQMTKCQTGWRTHDGSEVLEMPISMVTPAEHEKTGVMKRFNLVKRFWIYHLFHKVLRISVQLLGKSKVGDFDNEIGEYENIPCGQIPVYDLQANLSRLHLPHKNLISPHLFSLQMFHRVCNLFTPRGQSSHCQRPVTSCVFVAAMKKSVTYEYRMKNTRKFYSLDVAYEFCSKSGADFRKKLNKSPCGLTSDSSRILPESKKNFSAGFHWW